MHTTELNYDTRDQPIVDLSDDIESFCHESQVADGLLNVFAPHATAGIALIETGANSDHDLVDTLERLLPRDDDLYRHRHGSAGHGADHVLPAIVSPSVTIPVVDGRPALGTWQSVVLVDLNVDNPRRRVRVSLVEGTVAGAR